MSGTAVTWKDLKHLDTWYLKPLNNEKKKKKCYIKFPSRLDDSFMTAVFVPGDKRDSPPRRLLLCVA